MVSLSTALDTQTIPLIFTFAGNKDVLISCQEESIPIVVLLSGRFEAEESLAALAN